MNRRKLTKTQILKEISTRNNSSNTENAYDLNETGGFISDSKEIKYDLYPLL